jgi:hypothetical protein
VILIHLNITDMKKIFLLFSILFFSGLCIQAQYNLSAEYKYHREVNQIGARYNNFSNLNSSFNAGLRWNFGNYKGLGFFAGWNYHFRNTFKSGFTSGLTVNLDLIQPDRDESAKEPTITFEASLGYLGFYADNNRLTGWYQLHLGYSLGHEQDETDDMKDKGGPFREFRVMPGVSIGYKF